MRFFLASVRARAGRARHHAGARADRVRPAGRRLRALHGASPAIPRCARRAATATGAAGRGPSPIRAPRRSAAATLATCWLKNQVKPLVENRCCASGVKGAALRRDASRPDRELDRPHRRRLSQLRNPGQPGCRRPASRPARARTAAAPGPSRGRATAARRRAAISRTRSRRRGASRAACRAWCGRRCHPSWAPHVPTWSFGPLHDEIVAHHKLQPHPESAQTRISRMARL